MAGKKSSGKRANASAAAADDEQLSVIDMSGHNQISEYEAQRLNNIARNKQYMESLGLDIDLRTSINQKNGSLVSHRGLKTPSRKKTRVDRV